MPESRSRKKPAFTPPPRRSEATGKTMSAPWVAPAMVACFVIGLLWIVAFYLVSDKIGFMATLGNWNILIGVAFFVVGFVFATRWR